MLRTFFITIALLLAGAQLASAAPLIPLEVAPKPTGDALWDAYAGAVWQRLLQPEERATPFAALITDDEVATWDGVQSDPRSWQLRLWLNVVSAQVVDEYAGQNAGTRSSDYLAKAQTWTSVIDGRSEATITTRLYGLDVQEKLEVGHPPQFEAPALDDMRGFWFQYYDKVAGEGAAFDALKQEFPRNAWPYYLKAFYYERLRERGLALSELKAGNAKPDYALPALFPSAKADQLLADDISGATKLDTGNLIVAALVRQATEIERLPASLGELTDFMSANNSEKLPEYWSAYPLSSQVEDVIFAHDVESARVLADFASHTLVARSHDSRVAAVGLGVASGLVMDSLEQWQALGQTPPQTPLQPAGVEGLQSLPNLTWMAQYRQRMAIKSSYAPESLEWLYQQRFVAVRAPDYKEWEEHFTDATGIFNDHYYNPDAVAQSWHGTSPSGEAAASDADTVSILNGLSVAYPSVWVDSQANFVSKALHEQNWDNLLPPRAE